MKYDSLIIALWFFKIELQQFFKLNGSLRLVLYQLQLSILQHIKCSNICLHLHWGIFLKDSPMMFRQNSANEVGNSSHSPYGCTFSLPRILSTVLKYFSQKHIHSRALVCFTHDIYFTWMYIGPAICTAFSVIHFMKTFTFIPVNFLNTQLYRAKH